MRKVFFSFHYENDIRRVVQVRNSWQLRATGETQPFLDKADWESKKDTQIESWIEEQLKGTSVTVVLIGSETYSRKWVLQEIKRSYELKKGIIGVRIHKVKDPQNGISAKGNNPLDKWKIKQNGRDTVFSSIYDTYDYVADDGYTNLSSWIEKAAVAAGR